jgi:flavin reductase (DIM6/NTAB) family NADH-FMN oxidoreductase RutF
LPISRESYLQLGRSLAGAVAVVAAIERGTDAVIGLTVSSFVSLSLEPPLVMFAIQHDANSYPAIVASKCFGVSVLGTHQTGIARRFAIKCADKAADTAIGMGVELPVPLVADSLAQVECATSQIIVGGDHAIVVGRVEAIRVQHGEPLVYYGRAFGSFTPLAV